MYECKCVSGARGKNEHDDDAHEEPGERAEHGGEALQLEPEQRDRLHAGRIAARAHTHTPRSVRADRERENGATRETH